jgi:hypothetical protein
MDELVLPDFHPVSSYGRALFYLPTLFAGTTDKEHGRKSSKVYFKRE